MTALVGVGLALSILLLELAFRLAAHALPEPLHWHDAATQCKEAQVDALRRRGGVDVVYIGTSMMLFSVDPLIVDANTGLRSYNASIFRAVPNVSLMWLRDVVLPRLKPKVVVVGLSGFDLNDNGLLATRYDEYRAAPRFRYGWIRKGLVALGRYSYLCRYAFLFRRPRTLLPALARGLSSPRLPARDLPELPQVLGPRGQGLEFQHHEYADMPKMVDLIRQQAVDDWEDRGEQRAALRGILDEVRNHGGEVLFLEMPVTQEFTRFFVGGTEQWQRVRDDLVAEVSSWGARVLTLPDHSDRAFFADMIHMNGRGRDAFSAALSQALVEEETVTRLIAGRAPSRV